jgi:hypothetical protein
MGWVMEALKAIETLLWTPECRLLSAIFIVTLARATYELKR